MLNIFKKKKSTIIDNILKQHYKILKERSKLEIMELEIDYSILSKEQRNIRNDVEIKRYDADNSEFQYLMSLINLRTELQKRKE